MSQSEINPLPYIDRTLLDPTATPEQIDRAGDESAIACGFVGV